jgi:hypothetical protein
MDKPELTNEETLDEALYQAALAGAVAYAATDDEIPREYFFRRLTGMRASERIVVTFRREHAEPQQPVILDITEVAVA